MTRLPIGSYLNGNRRSPAPPCMEGGASFFRNHTQCATYLSQSFSSLATRRITLSGRTMTGVGSGAR